MTKPHSEIIEGVPKRPNGLMRQYERFSRFHMRRSRGAKRSIDCSILSSIAKVNCFQRLADQ